MHVLVVILLKPLRILPSKMGTYWWQKYTPVLAWAIAQKFIGFHAIYKPRKFFWLKNL